MDAESVARSKCTGHGVHIQHGARRLNMVYKDAGSVSKREGERRRG